MAGAHWRRDAQKEAYWLKTLGDWSKSGISCNAYCERKGLSRSTFVWWKRELGRRGKWPNPATGQRNLPGKASEPTHPPFLPIAVISASRPDLKLIVSERYRVDVPRGFDPDTLVRLLMVLDSRGC
jgi:hypothetical protein